MDSIDQKKIFARNLSSYITKNRKSQKEIADAIGVSPQTFNTWCQGIALPRMGKVQLLADYFGISKADLIEDHTITPLPSPKLREDEEKLLSLYNALNDAGQEKALSDMEDLTQLPKYTEREKLQKA